MKKIIKTFVFLLIFGLGYSLGVAVFENFEYNSLVKEFTERGVLVNTINYDGYNYNYYEVERVHDYEFDNKPTIINDSPANLVVGRKGDILLTPQSPFPYAWGIHEFVSFFFGGHSVLISDNNNSIIQSTGINAAKGISLDVIIDTVFHDGVIKDDDVVAEEITNYFFRPNYRSEQDSSFNKYKKFYRTEVLGLRVKNISDAQIDIAVDYAKELVNKALYNYLFVLDYKEKYYCTDLVSRSYKNSYNNDHEKINLNDDGFITSVNDLVLSEDSYLFFYWKVEGDNVNLYYLKD